MKIFLIIFLISYNFSFGQENDLYIKALVNDTIFINKLHYNICDTIKIIDKTRSVKLGKIENNKKQLFIVSYDFTDSDRDPFKYNRDEYNEIIDDKRIRLIDCSTLFIESLMKKGNIVTIKYFCPQKDLLGTIIFKSTKKKLRLLKREMGKI